MYTIDAFNAPKYMMKSMLDDVTKAYKANYPATVNNKKAMPSIHLFAHNAGKFDNKIILKAIYELHRDRVSFAPSHISDMHHDIFQITIQYNGFNIVFRDSMKLLLSSVDRLNSAILNNAYPKMPMDFKVLKSILTLPDYYEAFTRYNKDLVKQLCGFHPYYPRDYPIPRDYINAYCENDCVVVANALIKFGETIEKSVGFPVPVKECITISSMAMFVFTRKFNNISDTPLMSIGLRSAASSFIRNAYIGGRVEVFNSGINLGTINHFDVPGMYALCITKELPYGNPVFVSDFLKDMKTIEFLRNLHGNNLIGFFKCEVVTPEDLNIPVLGIKSDNGKLVFPLGEISGT